MIQYKQSFLCTLREREVRNLANVKVAQRLKFVFWSEFGLNVLNNFNGSMEVEVRS